MVAFPVGGTDNKCKVCLKGECFRKLCISQDAELVGDNGSGNMA